MKKAFVALTLGLFVCACSVPVLYFSGHYLPGQTVNGVDVSWETPSAVLRQQLNTVPTYVTVKAGEKDYRVADSVILEYDATNLQQSFVDWFKRTPMQFSVVSDVNMDVLRGYLERNRKPYTNAEITCVDGFWKLTEDADGFCYDVDKALSSLSDYHIDLDAIREYPTVRVVDLQENFDNVVWLNDFQIVWQDGTEIKGSELSQYVLDYVLQLPEDYIKKVVESLKDAFSTSSGNVVCNHPETGAQLTVPKKTFGKEVNTKKEIEYVQELLESQTSEINRVPILSGYDQLGDTYVVVSIDEQHLWYVKDGELDSDTDIVTGHKGRHDTPTGAYYITECIPGKYLTGDTYRTWVNQWMRLTNSGIGLHDAYWRGKFGSNVFTYNGSHGCINIPKDYAAKLYKESFVGMPVLIY